MSKDIYKPKPVSGFPEWLPGWRRLEQQWLDTIRATFESYGYINIETPAVEDVNVLQAKGDISKEIYGLHRLNAEAGEDKDARLALHFDLTVPMARYVAMNFNDLDFPFKRYAMQKVWRGERPQKGRMREFYQCDIDVIGVDNLPLHFDAEMPAVMHEVFTKLGFNAQVRISNRKILMGLFADCGVEDTTAAVQIVDKLEKIGGDEMAKELYAIGVDQATARRVEQWTKEKWDLPALEKIANNMNEGMMRDGFNDLIFVMKSLKHLPEGAVVADLSIARGLDYYTGTVYETRLLDVPEFTGSVCSGGRYDDLAGRFINKKLPGVGISIGLSRLFEVLKDSGRLTALNPSPTDVLVLYSSEDKRADAMTVAANMRQHYNVEVSHSHDFKKSHTYAKRKGIRILWFADEGRFEDQLTGLKGQGDYTTFKIQ